MAECLQTQNTKCPLIVAASLQSLVYILLQTNDGKTGAFSRLGVNSNPAKAVSSGHLYVTKNYNDHGVTETAVTSRSVIVKATVV